MKLCSSGTAETRLSLTVLGKRYPEVQATTRSTLDYISAIRDVIIRARQLKEFGGAEDILPETWTRPYDRSGKWKPAPTPELSFPAVMSVIYRYIELCLAPARNESRSFHYTEGRPCRRSPHGAKKKSSPLETSGHTTRNELTGTLIINDDAYQLYSVVVKVASTKRESERLYQEYSKHMLFRKNGCESRMS
ncbi:hypothetical protein F5887DRAFT_263869 [Amanita rubescens]|nr:hypothetical protein F5887DRAFT_263869 [Amanita rubescens]